MPHVLQESNLKHNNDNNTIGDEDDTPPLNEQMQRRKHLAIANSLKADAQALPGGNIKHELLYLASLHISVAMGENILSNNGLGRAWIRGILE